jgi:hypothetical protein
MSNIDTLIIDLYYNGGGPLGTMTFVPSYLLDGTAVRLIDFIDHNGTVNSYSTTIEAELPENSMHFSGSKRLLTAFLLQKQVTSLGIAPPSRNGRSGDFLHQLMQLLKVLARFPRRPKGLQIFFLQG